MSPKPRPYGQHVLMAQVLMVNRASQVALLLWELTAIATAIFPVIT
jgi:hypothetical protein